MPLYTYECPECHRDEEVLCKYEERDDQTLTCSACDVEMVRKGGEVPVHRMNGRYRFKAVMGDGSKVRVGSNRGDA